tara:strand:- start:2402 stop:3688 length:1287 start_codon:yes stop_codon:yes gene_type:complete
MKIYNEVVSRFNEATGQWETISEDSFDYGGPVDLAQGGMPPNASPINTSDTISDTIKTTAGYFTGGDGTISGLNIHTGSLADKAEKYYFNVMQAPPASASAETQFSVTFGHIEGSGSDTVGDSGTNLNTLNGETEAVYKQLTSLLLSETEASGGFKISAHAGGSGVKPATGDNQDEYVYALFGKRERFKDRLNKKSWTLTLSGSTGGGTGTKLKLTDDSATVAAVATPGGPRYNIVSGSLGTVKHAYTTKTYGWYYPEMGCMLFSGCELSASMPGPSGSSVGGTTTSHISTFSSNYSSAENLARISGSGFAPNLINTRNANNALRLVNCMKNMGSSTTLRLRSEEDQTQENYFCRIKAAEYNFSANPTFVSGSKNKIRAADMHGNPQTFITGVGLYNSAGQLLAIAKLSSPLKKNFASEATIKVKLTY